MNVKLNVGGNIVYDKILGTSCIPLRDCNSCKNEMDTSNTISSIPASPCKDSYQEYLNCYDSFSLWAAFKYCSVLRKGTILRRSFGSGLLSSWFYLDE